MALNFNLMNTDLPGQIATSVTRGYEGAQDRANVLEQREQQKRDRLAKIIQDGAKSIVATPGAYKSVFTRVKKVAGVPLDDDERQYDEAFATGGEEAVKKLAMSAANLDIQTVLSLRDREAFEAYLKGQQPATAPANALTAARVAPGALGSGTFDPTAPTNALAPTPATQAPTTPVNALTSAPVDQRTAIQNEILQLSRFTDPRAAARVKALEKQLDQLQMMEVGGNVFDPTTQTFIQGPAKSDALSPEALRQKLQIAAAGRAPGSTVILPPQEKAEKGERGKMLVNQYSGISDAAKIASKTIPSLENNLSILDKGFKTGFGTESIAAGAKVLAALGVEGAEKLATNSQTFLANANAAVLQRQLEQKGPQTESDAQRITATGAQLGNTSAANKFLITVAKEQAKRDIEQRNFYDRWWKQNNTYDGAEDAWYSGEGGKSLFDRPALRQYSVSTNAAAQIPTVSAPVTAPVAPAARAIPPAAIQMLLSGQGTDAQFDAIFGAGAAKRVRGGR
jgi:hypothetical protein